MEASNQTQLQIHDMPLIIVIKGHSSSKKREIAISLAKFLRYPLIDENDITLALRTSVSFSPTFSKNALAFNIIRQITKTQLQLKLQLVIDLSFHQDNYIDSFLELAVSEKANLVIVECIGDGDSQCQVHDYKDAPARFLTIDMSKSFIVPDFAPTLTNAVKSLEKVVLPQEISDQSLVSTSKASLPDGRKIVPQRIFKQAHAHEFSFIEKLKIDSAGKKLFCNQCEVNIYGRYYQCVVCDDFILDEFCAKYVTPNPSKIARYAPFYQLSYPSEYNFAQEYNCKLCDKYFSSCNHCLLQTHIKNELLPTLLQYEDHIHPLSFVIMPFWFDYEYKCIVCNKFGKSISYKCYSCCIDLHTTCALPELHEVCREGPIVALGPWGGPGNKEWNDDIHFTVRRLMIREIDWIRGLDIQYDDKGETNWKSHGGFSYMSKDHLVELDYPNEYLTSICGYIGPQKSLEQEAIRSLIFHSNKRTFGPFKIFFFLQH